MRRLFPLSLALVVLQGQSQCNTDVDQDKDDWTVEQGDCDDSNPEINPGAAEQCDGIDNNCDGGIDEGLLGSSSTCAASSCEAIRLSGVEGSSTYWIQPEGAADALLAWCDMTSSDTAITLYTTQAILASLDATAIFATCPAGWTPFQYLTTAHVSAAQSYASMLVSSGETSSTYYLANAFAGPYPNCDSTQNLTGTLDASNTWIQSELDLNATYGGFMKDNCNLNIFDPIPLSYQTGPATTSGTTVLWNSYETSTTYPVLCSVM